MSSESPKIDEIEDTFLAGNLKMLKGLRCPNCEGFLSFSIALGAENPRQPLGRRFRCGINIYCVGDCQTMISHMDGFCPAWAETISDWDSFSTKLYEKGCEAKEKKSLRSRSG